MCIGASLARIESRIAFECLFDRFSKLKVLDENPQWGKNLIFRGFDHLRLKLLKKKRRRKAPFFCNG